MYRAVVASATVAIATSEYTSYRHEQTVTEKSNTFSANSYTNPYLALWDSSTAQVNIFANSYTNQLEQEYEELTTLESPATISTEFGRSINLFGDTKTGNQLMISAKRGAFVYKGDYSSWSVSQTLIPSDINATGLELSAQHGDYGESNSVDKNSFNTAVFGCSSCETSPGNFEGALFVYEVTPKSKGDWTHTQTLYSNFVSPISDCGGGIVPASFGIGQSVELDRNTILTSAQYSYCATSGVSAFWRERVGGQWSEQQIFHLTDKEIYRYDVEDDTILLSAIDVTVNAASNVGAVFVNYPDTKAYGAKPKPKATPHWSVHQILTPPTAYQTADRQFGLDVTINGNQAVVTSASSSMFVYERKTQAGMWSLQQVITDAAVQEFREAEFDGSDIYVVSRFVGVSEVRTNKYSTNQHWDCLVVSVEDQFGDGWDGAVLQIETPSGEKSTYAPVCAALDNEDVWQIRYCPRTVEDSGLYKLSVVDAPKSKFFWEIQWRVFDEASGAWYQGNHATHMDFHFDSHARSFSKRAITKNIDANITCHTCPPKPKPKPSPKRALKGHTHAPTISPAPTLAQTENYENWQYMEMSGADWFDEQHKGTNFYISDKDGHRLVSTGTKCGSEPEMCWQNLPDGEYILRVTGNLNKDRDSATWAFCGRVGTYGTQLDFKVSKGECDALASFSRQQFCTDVIGASMLSQLQIILYGIPEYSDISHLSVADRKSFAAGLAGLLSGVAAKDITITGLQMIDGLSVLEVQVRTETSAVGVDFRDLSGAETYEANLVAQLTGHAQNGNLWTALSMSTVEGSSFFNKVTGATIKSADLVYMEVDTVQGSEEEVATSYADGYYLSFFPKGGLTVEAVAASLGYIIAGVAFVVVVGAVVHSRLQPRDYEGVDSTTSSALSEIESASPKRAAPSVSNPMAQSTRGYSTRGKTHPKLTSHSAHGSRSTDTRKPTVDAPKKSVALNALMMADRR